MRVNTEVHTRAQAIAILVNSRKRVWSRIERFVNRGEAATSLFLAWDVLTHAIAYLQRKGERPIDPALLSKIYSGEEW